MGAMSKKKKKKKKKKKNATLLHVKDYPRLIARFDPELRARLEAASIFLDRSANRIMTDAVRRFLDGLNPSVKKSLTKLVKDLELEGRYE